MTDLRQFSRLKSWRYCPNIQKLFLIGSVCTVIKLTGIISTGSANSFGKASPIKTVICALETSAKRTHTLFVSTLKPPTACSCLQLRCRKDKYLITGWSRGYILHDNICTSPFMSNCTTHLMNGCLILKSLSTFVPLKAQILYFSYYVAAWRHSTCRRFNSNNCI